MNAVFAQEDEPPSLRGGQARKGCGETLQGCPRKYKSWFRRICHSVIAEWVRGDPQGLPALIHTVCNIVALAENQLVFNPKRAQVLRSPKLPNSAEPA